MRKQPRAVTLIELVAVAGIGALLVSLAFPTLGRSRELSKRLVCTLNLKGIGAVTKIYAQTHDGGLMIPAFKNGRIDQGGIDYVNDTPDVHQHPTDPCEVGYDREFESTSEGERYPNVGSVSLPTTRAFWMLVRSGDVHVQQFVCPSSFDTVDDPEALSLYYDFEGYNHISYGYQVPFGPRLTRPNDGADRGRVQAADKGPFYVSLQNMSWTYEGRDLRIDSPPEAWRRFNSPNHGGPGNGEGQNILFPDGGVCFQSKPIVGVDYDNIYTLMLDRWDSVHGYGRIHGELPQTAPTPPYPGQDAFGQGPGNYSSTDSLIYP